MASKKLLLVTASQDTVTPVELAHYSITSALNDAGAKHLTSVVLDTDHMFLSKRIALTQLLVRWLRFGEPLLAHSLTHRPRDRTATRG